MIPKTPTSQNDELVSLRDAMRLNGFNGVYGGAFALLLALAPFSPYKAHGHAVELGPLIALRGGSGPLVMVFFIILLGLLGLVVFVPQRNSPWLLPPPPT